MQFVKMLLDLGPLVVFFVVWYMGGGDPGPFDDYLPTALTKDHNAFFPATAALMVTTLVALAASFIIFNKLPVMPMVTAVLVMVFGGLTLYMADETFLKMKPTFIYLLFAVVLGVGMFFNKPLLKIMFDEAFALTPEGWRVLTWRWAFFFAFLAVLNEVVWRNFSTEMWIKVKVFGFIALTMVFAIAQVGIIQKFSQEKED
ncbi:MAG: septation protein A [Hyphomicrobiaceae bacterium]|nr:septation protein A [Hyphomicrobiaceae bacterium]